jgi:hypothetical protein
MDGGRPINGQMGDEVGDPVTTKLALKVGGTGKANAATVDLGC